VPTTVRRLAELVHGEVHGNGDLVIQAARPLTDAGPGDITFAESERYADRLHACRASAAVVPLESHRLATNGLTVIRVAEPLAAFIALYRHLLGRDEPPPHGIDPHACVDPTAVLGPDASVLPLAVIGAGTVIGARCHLGSGAVVGRRCRLGDDVVLHPGVVVYDDSVLGNRVTVHANSVLGADGFGYRHDKASAGKGPSHVKVPQMGWVEVEDDVEIGACTTIDRGTFGPTRIGAGTKIDNLVQVAHNCRIGRHNLLISQMGIAGSSTTGDHVIAAGQVGIADHVIVGDRVVMGAKAGVTKDIPPGERVLGSPATPLREQKRILMSLEKLPEMRREIRRIKQHLGLADEP